MRPKQWDVLWFLVCAILSSIGCVTAARQLSATFDEPIYVTRGLEHWRTGSSSGLMKLGTMPLPVDVDTFPLYVWERWRGLPIDPVAEWEQLLPWFRVGTLVFWWLLLTYAWRIGSLLAGRWGGRLAVALLAAEPSFLAHASLGTTDIAVTACVLAFVYHFRTGRECTWPRRLAVPAFWFGAALLAKASALVFGPLCMLVLEMERLFRLGDQPVAQAARLCHIVDSGSFPRNAMQWLKPLAYDFAMILGGGVIVAFIYCGCDWQTQPSFVTWAHAQADKPWGASMVWLAEHLRIFSNAGEGFVRQIGHNVRGHGAYILGESQPRSIWYYFPILLTIKLTLPLLVLPALLLILKPRALFNWACLTAGILLLFSLTYRVQIGIRLILPAVALGVVGMAAAVVRACQDWNERSKEIKAEGEGRKAEAVALNARFSVPSSVFRLPPFALRTSCLIGCVSLGLLWTTVASMCVWPEGLCYVNELWGGTENGYVIVSEANYDWGQGLLELVRWERKAGLSHLDVWYFGSDPALKTLPLRDLPLQDLPIHRPEDVRTFVHGRYLAVSTSFIYGRVIDPDRVSYQNAVAYFRSCRPVARTPTFLIFDFK